MHTHRAKRNRTRVRVCISPQHARVSTQKHTITELTHQNKMFPHKKKCTLQHQYALLMVVVVAVSACTRRHNKYTHQHSTHIRTSGMYAPVAKQNKTPAPVQTKYAHQHRTHTRTNKKRKKIRTTHTRTNAHSSTSQYTRAWWWCACVCLRSMHAPVQKQNTSTSTNKIRSPAPHSEQIKKSKKKNAHSSTSMHAPRVCVCVCVCVRMSVCVSAQHAHTSTKNTLTAPHSHTRKKMHSFTKKKKEKCTLQHQYARTWWCCACVRACVRAHVCVYICGMHAPVAKQNTSTALTYQKKQENAHSSSSMHAPGAYVRVCLRLDLLLTPAPVSACGGGGVCLWLAFLFRFVGALCIMCGVCVFECEWAFIYWVRASR